MIIGFAGKMQVGKDLSARIVQCLMYENSNPEYPLENKIEDIVKSPSMIFVPKGMRGFVNIETESGWKTVKFADKLKDIVCLLLGCTRVDLENKDFKEQELGEEWWQYTHEGSDKMFITKELAIESASKYYINRGRHSVTLIDWLKESVITFKPTPRFLLQYIGTDLFRTRLHPNTWVNATMADYRPPKLSEYSPSKWIISDVRFPNEVQAIKEKGGIVIKLERDNAPISNHLSETALDNYKHFDYVISNNGTIEQLIDNLKQTLEDLKLI